MIQGLQKETISMNDPELVEEFVTESSEHLADIENQLLQIESSGADIDVELVNTVFRGVHSIKGVAGFLGLDSINSLAHHLEDILNRIRNLDLIPNQTNINVLLKAADCLRTMVATPEESNGVDITQHLVQLKSVLETPSGEMPVKEPLRQAGDAEKLSTDALQAVTAELQDSTMTSEVSTGALSTESGSSSPRNTSQKESNNDEVKPSEASEQPERVERPKPAIETKIRVPVSTLDHLMNLAGELVLNRNRLLQFTGGQGNPALAAISSDIDHITCELQDAIMQTRMQPIATAFNRFPRIVRDLSASLGKECDLQIEGKDVEVDKSIAEAISDPLTHIIRNSVDHGIELPETRRKSSKREVGRIQLKAYHRAGQVCIDITDDGAGIDPEKLKKSAIAKGVITERQASELGPMETLRLIFHPGFSTAEKLTDVSGRGVGMDVVRTNIEQIGGTVDIESEVGVGTTMHIVLPLTLAIIRSLIVSCESRRFAIPQVNVAEIVRISESERDARISNINNAVVFRLRGDLVPLINLSEIMGLAADENAQNRNRNSNSATNIVVLETGRSRYGIIVDELFDSEEIVVKPLGQHLKKCPSFAGATILGDGHVALILDISGIAVKARLDSLEEKTAIAVDENGTESLADSQSLLLLQNRTLQHFAIPMELVERIERVDSSAIESYDDKSVMKYRGGVLPLLSIDTLTEPPTDSEQVSVVVLKTNSREYGLIAHNIKDICEISLDVDTESLADFGIVGSQVINGDTTRILDVGRLYSKAYPGHQTLSASAGDEQPPTVLLAEDSTFFRKQVAGFLKELNYQVVEAADGEEAWSTLQNEPDKFDLVVTDIEMPNMDGFEFCRRIRAHDSTRDLPVIALTSLSTDENIRRGRDVGITEYQVKLDREKLVSVVGRLTQSV